ncbi:MAG: alkaline phosphatase D family protein [Microthrixaceae bacterium]
MLGAQQREWLLGSLETSDARWRVIGSQMMFWPWRTLGRCPGSRGDGHVPEPRAVGRLRGRAPAVLDRLEQHDVRDTLMFSGDSHVFSAAQVAPDVDDPGSTPRVLEFGAGSVTSNNADENGFPTDEYTGPFLRSVNPNHLRYFESERHGYAVAELTPSSASVEFRSPSTILAPTSARTDVLARLHGAQGRPADRQGAAPGVTSGEPSGSDRVAPGVSIRSQPRADSARHLEDQGADGRARRRSRTTTTRTGPSRRPRTSPVRRPWTTPRSTSARGGLRGLLGRAGT